MKTNVAAIASAFFVAALGADGVGAEAKLTDVIRKLFDTDAISVEDDNQVVTIEWRCPGVDWEVAFCIVGSTQTYWTVFQGIRNKKIDVTGRLLNFRTRMHRHRRDGKDEDIVLLAATWDGTQLMRTNWRSTSIGAAIDRVTWLQADQHFPTDWALGEACNGLYSNSPRFCALAKLSSRR